MGTEIKKETVRLSEQIRLQRLFNTRDLGGIKTADGRFIRPYRLIRSGALSDASPEDLRILKDVWKLGTVVDFRTGTERRQKPDPEIEGVVNLENPILSEATVGITFEKEEGKADGGAGKDPMISMLEHASSLGNDPRSYIDKLYVDLILDGHATEYYRAFFDILLNADSRAVLWHCTAGKDRVGVGTALLLTALGVERETVIRDFVRTNDFVMEGAEGAARAVEQKTKNRELANCVKVLLTVSREYIENAFAAMEEAEGSAEAYLERRLGLTAERREALREKFLTDTDPMIRKAADK